MHNIPLGEKPFYAKGLRFSCTRCSDCCRLEPGFVFLREKDVSFLASLLKMRYTDFITAYCRWVPSGGGEEQLALKEKSNYDCIFWKEGCTVYERRPLQCRTYPFWLSMLDSEETWNSLSCPGMGRGAMHSFREIESVIALQTAEPVICRPLTGSRSQTGEEL
jgi:Fe-S-cluster containining protein